MDREEFTRRVRGSRDRLYHVAIAILCREADAEDAAQEALLRAWRHLPGLKDERYFDTWLMRILIRECQRALRRRSKEGGHTDPARLEQTPAPEPIDRDLREALDRLDVRYRLPVVLHYVEDYTLAQTARLLRLSEGAAKWRVRRGVDLLREMLNEKEGTP